MRVYLIKTPEFSEEEFQNIYNLLETFEGPLEFLKIDLDFDKEKFPFLKKFYRDFKFKYESDTSKIYLNNERGMPLSWRELFSLCTYYRETFKIEICDFVVLLTNRRNALNWFSAFDINRNIFVHTNEWDSFTNANPKYPIAYQIIENVMQFFMKLDIGNPNDPNIHFKPRGCMNDFCNNKGDVIIKMQTANICNDCMKKIHTENIENNLIAQAFRIFDGVRNELIFKTRAINHNNTIQYAITVTKQNRIFVGDLEIRLTPLRKTLYLFFLRNKLVNENGILFNELSNYYQDLLKIYMKLTVSSEQEVIETRINSLVNSLGNTFAMEKSKINSIISDTLGQDLADSYIISGQRLMSYKIKLSSDLIQIQN